MHRHLFLFSVLLLILFGGIYWYAFTNSGVDAPAPEIFAPRTATVPVRELNGSGESGKAVLSETEGGLVRVRLELAGYPENASQPANIHAGSCASPGPVRHPLTSAMNGLSETVLGASFEGLRKGSLVLVVRRSSGEAEEHVSCAELSI